MNPLNFLIVVILMLKIFLFCSFKIKWHYLRIVISQYLMELDERDELTQIWEFRIIVNFET